LYVDDILLIGNNIPLMEDVKASLRKSSSMKDLGEASYILCIKIYRDRSNLLIGLRQSTYIDKALNRFNINESKRGFIPVTWCHLERYSPYASAIGSIMYAMICTRPDVSYALRVTSKYQSNPGDVN
jgi:hypothetical protein